MILRIFACTYDIRQYKKENAGECTRYLEFRVINNKRQALLHIKSAIVSKMTISLEKIRGNIARRVCLPACTTVFMTFYHVELTQSASQLSKLTDTIKM